MSKLNLRTELGMKYGSTYIRLQVNSSAPKELFYMQGTGYEGEDERIPVLSENKHLYVHGAFVDKGGKMGEGIRINLSDYIVDLSIPEEGYRNSKVGAHYLDFKIVKQYKRALSLHNINMQYIANINDLMDIPKYYTIEEAVEKVLSTSMQTAISQHFALGIYSTSKAVFIKHKGEIMGVVRKNEKGFYGVVPESRKYIVEDLQQFMICEVVQ